MITWRSEWTSSRYATSTSLTTRSSPPSFINVCDPRVAAVVDRELADGLLWPEALVGLRPSFAPGGSIDGLICAGALGPATSAIFRRGKSEGAGAGAGSRALRLHRHQNDVIRATGTGANQVLATGMDS